MRDVEKTEQQEAAFSGFPVVSAPTKFTTCLVKVTEPWLIDEAYIPINLPGKHS